MAPVDQKPRVLFLCTGNACRSQMAEAIARHLGGGRLAVYSAGSHPAGFIHPLAVETLQHLGVPIDEEQHSKSWHVYADADLDVVITLCDAAATEPCPVWPGEPIRVHWPLPDPSFHPGPPAERLQAAIAVAESLRRRVLALLREPLETMPPEALRPRLVELANDPVEMPETKPPPPPDSHGRQ